MVETIQSNSEKGGIHKKLGEEVKHNPCRRCGSCCKTKGLFEQSSFIEKISYRFILLITTGFRGFKNPKCKHLRFRSRNSYCAIHETRPDFCRKYFCERAINNKEE